MPKVEHLVYGDRKVFTVSAFNRGLGLYLGRLPNVWVEGEVTELRRNPAWANVFLTLKDPKTAATLQKNLAVIDQAISESRAAMRSQPTNQPAQQSLVENFKTKIALLQDTVALINEMRKGNEAGAARIVSGLKTKGN